MKNALRASSFATSLLFAARAVAMLPESGWYWNPAESGRGFNVEVQDNKLFVSGFVYDASGNPQWFVSGGVMSSDREYSGTAYATAGGQCLGCAYRAPTNVAFGTLTLSFANEQTATLTLNGSAVALQREQFGYDFSSATQPLLGEWATTEGDKGFGLYFGERLTLSGTMTTNSGTVASGTRTGGSSNAVVGVHDPSTGSWAMLLDSSLSYYKFYVFNFVGLNRIEGNVSTYLKGSTPNGSLPFLASRVRGAASAAGQNAPGTDKARVLLDRGAIDAFAAAAGEEGGQLVSIRALARSLEAALAR